MGGAAPDELVLGRFRLGDRLGSGGMGTVYRGFDERLQRDVAVKEVEAGDPERVLREAQAAARLNHPAIVTLYELGERRGNPLLVSELVPGPTLAELRAAGALSDREIAELGCDLCEALAHAHAHGVVHRDVKPQNVIVRDDGDGGQRAKLMDFGVASLSGAPTLTAAGEVVGTLAYMSPEQADGLEAGPESDLYSLALTLYECWAGANPVAGATPAETARRIGTALPPLREHRPDLPEGLTDLIDACLDPDPDLRPLPAELAECLEAELATLDDERRPRLRRSDPAPARLASRLRLAALVACAALLALLAGPLGLPGLALVLAVLLLPVALAGAAPVALAAPLGGALGVAGAGPAAAAFAALAPRPFERLALGAGAWLWMAAGALVAGAGSRLGLGPPAPAGWSRDAGEAARTVLEPLLAPEALLGMAVFALAAAALGWVISLRHTAPALLGAMLWAAGLDAALGVVADGSLGGQPGLVVAAALPAFAGERLLRRREAPAPPRHGERELGGRLSGRLA